jgi:hypothetical protein
MHKEELNNLSSILNIIRSQGGSVSIVSDYGLTGRPAIGVRSPAEAKDFSCTVGTVGPLPGSEARPGHDADHSPPPSMEVKNE